MTKAKNMKISTDERSIIKLALWAIIVIAFAIPIVALTQYVIQPYTVPFNAVQTITNSTGTYTLYRVYHSWSDFKDLFIFAGLTFMSALCIIAVAWLLRPKIVWVKYR